VKTYKFVDNIGVSYRQALPPEKHNEMCLFLKTLSHFGKVARKKGYNPDQNDIGRFMLVYSTVFYGREEQRGKGKEGKKHGTKKVCRDG